MNKTSIVLSVLAACLSIGFSSKSQADDRWGLNYTFPYLQYIPSVQAIVVNPVNPEIVYVGLATTNLKGDSIPVWKSTNGGDNWFPTDSSSFHHIQGPERGWENIHSLCINPRAPETLYASGHAYDRRDYSRIFRTTDGGVNWDSLNSVYGGEWNSSPAYLALSPSSPSFLFVGRGIYCFKSTNGGLSWADTSNPAGQNILSFAIYETNPETLYVGTQSSGHLGGLYVSLNGGASWPYQLFNATINCISIHPQDKRIIFLGVSNRAYGFYKSTDGGANWVDSSFAGCNVSSIVIDSLNPQILYAGLSSSTPFNWGVWKSTDGGSFWGPLNSGLPDTIQVYSLAIKPVSLDSTILFLGDNGGHLYRYPSSDHEGPRFNTFFFPPDTVYYPGIPSPPYTIKSIITDLNGVDTASLYLRTDPQTAWSIIPMNRGTSDTFSVDIPETAIVFGHTLEYFLWAQDTWSPPNQKTDPDTTGGGYYRMQLVLSPPESLSISLGDQFVDLSWKLPLYGADSVRQYKIYRRTQGDYSLLDSLSSDSLHYRDSSIELDTLYYYVVTASYPVGESRYSNEVSGQWTGVEEGRDSRFPRVFALFQNHPNPFSGLTTIHYQLPAKMRVIIKIYNIAGQLVKALVNETRESGYYLVSWDGKDEGGRKVGEGVYFYRIQAGNYESTKKMILLK